MARRLFTNNAYGVLTDVLGSSGTEAHLSGDFVDNFPVPGPDGVVMCTLQSADLGIEIVQLTDRVDNVLTIVRAQEGTTARSFPAGSVMELRLTAGGLNDFAQAGQDELINGSWTFAEEVAIPLTPTQNESAASKQYADAQYAAAIARENHTGTQDGSTVLISGGTEDNIVAIAADGSLQDSAIPAGLVATALQPSDPLALLSSGAATVGQVPSADGAGGITWEDSQGGATNLGVDNVGVSTLDVTSDTGTDATLPAATNAAAGVATAAQIALLESAVQPGDEATVLAATGAALGQVATADGADGFTWEDPPVSLPTGGTTRQVLAKASGDDYDYLWQDSPLVFIQETDPTLAETVKDGDFWIPVAA